MPELLTESSSLAQAATPAPGPGRIKVQLINPGWGSSGYYGADVLEAAGKAKVFPKGTQMFINHQTEAERYDRPEGDLRDLAAVLETDATWDGSALVAEARVFSAWRQPIADMADAIGVSIRASADVAVGEAEGRSGRIVTELIEGRSVDFVTMAGRGGKVLEVLESARANIRAGDLTEATSNETNTALSAAVRDTYGADGVWTWVRDFDDANAWFSIETPDECKLWQQAYTIADDGAVTLSGAPTEVRVKTSYVPVKPAAPAATDVPSNPAGVANTNESKEIPLAKIEVDEAAHTAAVEASGRVPVLEAENTRLKNENRELREAGHKATAAQVVAEAFNGIEAPATIKLIAASYTLTESGDVDVAALKAVAEEAAAEHAVASGAGRVHGAGTTSQESGAITRDDVDATIAEAFGRTPKGAK